MARPGCQTPSSAAGYEERDAITSAQSATSTRKTRLAEICGVSTDAPVDFAIGLLQAALSVLTFIYAVEDTIGGALNIKIGGVDLTFRLSTGSLCGDFIPCWRAAP